MNDEERDELIGDWLDEEPTPGDAERMSAALVDDAALADRLAAAARLDQRLRRIAADARAVAPARRIVRFAVAIATTAAAAALVIAAAWWWPRDRRAVVVDGSGALRDGAALAAGARIPIGATVVAAAGGELRLRWPDHTLAELGSGGELTVGERQALALARGSLAIEAAPRGPTQRLTVTTPQAVISVVGTRFSLTVDAARTRVRVASGVVRVSDRDGGAVRDVVAGEEADARSTGRALVTGWHPGTLIDGGIASYWQGFRFVVGDRPLTVTALGRFASRGNMRLHALQLVDGETHAVVPGGEATVAMAGAPIDAFRYAPLADPPTLAAGHEYLLLSHEIEGADLSWDKDSSVTTTDAARVLGGALRTEAGEYFWMGGPGHTWGPVDFLAVAGGG